MKNISLIIILFLFANVAFAQENDTNDTKTISTYYLIRHAEKDRTINVTDPTLTAEGEKRAENWTKVFSKIKLDAVYSTDYMRTKKTVANISKSHNLKTIIYDPNNLNIEDFKQETNGQIVLIAGHSNTIPQFVNLLIGYKKYEDMADDDNASMYLVTFCGNESSTTILKID